MLRKMSVEEKNQLENSRKIYNSNPIWGIMFIIFLITIFLFIIHIVRVIIYEKNFSIWHFSKFEIISAILIYSVIILIILLFKTVTKSSIHNKEQLLKIIDKDIEEGVVDEEIFNFNSVYIVDFESDEEIIQESFSFGILLVLENEKIVYINDENNVYKQGGAYFMNDVEIEESFPYSKLEIISYPNCKKDGLMGCTKYNYSGNKTNLIGILKVDKKEKVMMLLEIRKEKELAKYIDFKEVDREIINRIGVQKIGSMN